MQFTTRRDRLLFLSSWLRDPLRIAAVQPSGRALAHLITSQIGAGHAPVVELGAGTGVFTHALIERGVPEHRLALVEGDPAFARMLATRFPLARVLGMNAEDVGRVDAFFADATPGAVVSGLPLLSMPPRRVTAILGGMFGHLRDDGAFYQFTYMPYCPVPARVLEPLGLSARRIGWVGANMPPAAVYRIARST